MGLGRKRVDPFMTRLSCLNRSCRGSPVGDPPDRFIFLFLKKGLQKKKKNWRNSLEKKKALVATRRKR
jgi:hypothetical protein